MADGHVVPMVVVMPEVAETVSVAAVAVETIEEPKQMDVVSLQQSAEQAQGCGGGGGTARGRRPPARPPPLSARRTRPRVTGRPAWRARAAWDGRGTIGEGSHNTKKESGGETRMHDSSADHGPRAHRHRVCRCRWWRRTSRPYRARQTTCRIRRPPTAGRPLCQRRCLRSTLRWSSSRWA